MQALHFAARNGHAATCELLIRSGAALESGAAKNQATPLLLAVEGSHQFPSSLLNTI
jgi:ankyrin repeat protein